MQEIMANATSTLALCAMETEEFAVAIDMARCHLKLFEEEEAEAVAAGHGHDHSHTHGHEEGAAAGSGAPPKPRSSLLAMWLLRGRAFAALGEQHDLVVAFMLPLLLSLLRYCLFCFRHIITPCDA
jgi:hypothetical protein